MTEIFYWGGLAFIVFAALAFSGFIYRKKVSKISGPGSHYTVAFIVMGSMVLVLVAWCGWAFYGAGELAMKLQKDNKEMSSRNVEKGQQNQIQEKPSTTTKPSDNSKEEDSPLAKAGQAGDMFGGFTALFSALTFCGAIGAVVFQAGAMRATQEQLILQQFEPMFLFLLHEFRRLDDKLELKIKPSDPFSTIDVAVKQWEFTLSQQTGRMQAHGLDKAALLIQISDFYKRKFYAHNEAKLGPFFRALYHVFKAIKNSNLTESQKIRYANIARISLNSDHLFLLTLNGLTPMGAGFKPLIEEYGILKHLFHETKPGYQAVARKPSQQIARLLYRKTATLNAARREKIWQKFPQGRPGPLTEE